MYVGICISVYVYKDKVICICLRYRQEAYNIANERQEDRRVVFNYFEMQMDLVIFQIKIQYMQLDTFL